MIEITDRSKHPDASDRNHAAYGRGVVHYKATNFYMAAQAFSESLEYWLEDPQAWFALGNCYDEIEKPKKAEACYRKSLEYSPDESIQDVYYNLANGLYDQGRYSEAIELYKKILPESSIYKKAQTNLALAENSVEDN